MNLLEVVALSNAGISSGKPCFITRRADNLKHSDWPWRIVGSVDTEVLKEQLAKLGHGHVLPIAGLERRGPDGRWASAGGLRSHQAKAEDWEVFEEKA
ncbi:MAG: hypothetical protein WC565_01730 [Parcubacteria group bacterium]